MKIIDVSNTYILFDNGSTITYEHESEEGERNYADFESIDSKALDYDFDERLIFVPSEEGFMFGDRKPFSEKRVLFSVPCYSESHGKIGYNDIDILYKGRFVISVNAVLK